MRKPTYDAYPILLSENCTFSIFTRLSKRSMITSLIQFCSMMNKKPQRFNYPRALGSLNHSRRPLTPKLLALILMHFCVNPVSGSFIENLTSKLLVTAPDTQFNPHLTGRNHHQDPGQLPYRLSQRHFVSSARSPPTHTRAPLPHTSAPHRDAPPIRNVRS